MKLSEKLLLLAVFASFVLITRPELPFPEMTLKLPLFAFADAGPPTICTPPFRFGTALEPSASVPM